MMKMKQSISVTLFYIYLLFSTGSFGQQFEKDSLSIRNKIDSAFYMKEKHFKNAVKLYDSSIQQAKALNSKWLINHSLYTGAMLDWYDGAHEEAIEKCREGLVLSAFLKDTVSIADNHSLLGLIYLYKADFDSSLYHLDKSIVYYQNLKDTTQIIKAFGFKGLIYNKQGDFVKAKENLLSTVVLKRKHFTTNWYLPSLSNDSEISKKYYEESLFNSKKVLLKLKEKTEVSMELRNAYRNVGSSYLRLNYYDSALIELKRSANISRLIGADIFWDELGGAYVKLGLYDSAIWCHNKSIEAMLEHGSRTHLAEHYYSLANTNELKGDYEKSIIAAKKALRLHVIMGQKYSQVHSMLFLGKVLNKNGELNLALGYTLKSIKLAESIGAKRGLVLGLKDRFDLLKKMGKYREAIEVKDRHDSLVESLQKGQVQLELAKLDLYNEVELNKLEIGDLNKQQKLAQANAKNKNLIILLIVIVGLFVVLLLALNYHRTRKLLFLNKKLNSQQHTISAQNHKLSESNKEKELLLGEIHHRVKNNLQTITSLLNIQQRKLKDPETIKVIEDSKNRVMAMGLIHQHLYQNATFAEIDFKNYTKELVHVLINTNATCEIQVKCQIPALKIELDNAIFFGLIINELAINSIKHAYEGIEKPLLEISIFEAEDKMALLVKDNGQAKDIDFDKSNSFGWKMVNNICDKLEAQLVVENSKGLSIKILFSKEIIDFK